MGALVNWTFVIGVVIGFSADVLRSVLLPVTTEWLKSFVPFFKKAKIKADNMQYLQIQDSLIRLGKDPALAEKIDSPEFRVSLAHNVDTSVSMQLSMVDSSNMTQADMNRESLRRAKLSEDMMQGMYEQILNSGRLSDEEVYLLKSSQEAWAAFRDKEVEFLASSYEGGSMQPLIANSAEEYENTARFVTLKNYYEELLEEPHDA